MKRNRYICITTFILIVLLVAVGCGQHRSKHNSSNQQPSTITDLKIPDTAKETMPPLPVDGVRLGSSKAVFEDWVKKGSDSLTTSKTGITVDGDTIKVKTDTDKDTIDPQLAWVQYKFDDWDTSVSLPSAMKIVCNGSDWNKSSSFYLGSSNYDKGIWDFTKAVTTTAYQTYNTKYHYLSKSNNHYIVLVFYGTFDLTIETTSIIPNLQGSPPGIIGDIKASDQTSNSEISVKWSPLSDADHYYLSRSESSDGSDPVNIYDSPDITEFKDVSVEANKAYYYSVYSTNKFGKSLPSVWAKGSRTAKPGEFKPANPPDTISVTPSEAESNIALTCGRVADATYYEFYRSIWENDPNRILIGIGVMPPEPEKPIYFTDKKAQRNVLYYYSAKACNGAGKTDFSITKSGSLAGKMPEISTPATPSASDGIYTDNIKVTWKAPSNGQIELWRSDDNDEKTPDLFLGEFTKDITSYNDKNGTKSPTTKFFYYRIRNYNTNNTSKFSPYDQGNTVPVTQVPGQVTDLVATSSTDSTVVLKWNYDMNFYQLVDRWWIYITTDSSDKYPSFWMNSDFVKDPVATLHPQTVTVKGLANGHTYYFYVKGENGNGKSILSNQASKATTGTYITDLVNSYWPKHLKTYDNLGNLGDTKIYNLSKPIKQFDEVTATLGHNGGGAFGIDRTLYLPSRDGKLIAFGISSEEAKGVKWIFDPRIASGASLPDTASVVAASSSVLTLNNDSILFEIQSEDPAVDGYLYCINRNGSLKWEFNLGKTPVTDSDIGGPSFANGYIVTAIQDPASLKRIIGIDIDGKEIFDWQPKDPNLRVFSPITFDLGEQFTVVIDSSKSALTGPYPLVVQIDKGVEQWTYKTLIPQANRTQLTKSTVPTRFFVNDIGTKYLVELDPSTGAELGVCDLAYLASKPEFADFKLAAQYVGILNAEIDTLPYLLIIGNPDTNVYKNSSIAFVNIDGALPAKPKKQLTISGLTKSQIFVSNQMVYFPMGSGSPNSIIRFDLFLETETGTGDLSTNLDGNVFITDSLGSLYLWGADDSLRIYGTN